MRARTRIYVVLSILALAAPFLGLYPVFLMKLLCFAMFACAFNLLLGYTKMLSFGHAAYFGSSAYVTGWLVTTHVWGTIEGIVAGVAVAMQTAQLLQQLQLHPKRTIRVIAWMNEENGGAGGRTYAKDYAADVPNHIAAIESDNGAGHPDGFKINAPPAAIQKLRRLALMLQGIGAGVLRPLEDIEADITPLQRLGVPTFGLLQDSRTYFNYHHTAADTLDKVDPRLLQENAAAMAMLAYTIASLPDPLPRNQLPQ
jgi:hypothetical protein